MTERIGLLGGRPTGAQHRRGEPAVSEARCGPGSGTRAVAGHCSTLQNMIHALALVLFATASGSSVASDAALWRGLGSGEHVALLRHAIAPGTGDPAEFSLDDCRTQRNLSASGRDQAARIGARFRANGIPMARVFSSQWCRCLETARLLGLGLVRPLPFLNSFFRRFERRDRQTRALRSWLRSQDLDEPTVLVTHQVNITALTGVYPASGEVVVIRPSSNGQMAVVGTIRTD